jgi:hypothetical protein
MKLTKTTLRQIIKEELDKILEMEETPTFSLTAGPPAKPKYTDIRYVGGARGEVDCKTVHKRQGELMQFFREMQRRYQSGGESEYAEAKRLEESYAECFEGRGETHGAHSPFTGPGALVAHYGEKGFYEGKKPQK